MYSKAKSLFSKISIERKKKLLKYSEGVKIWRLNTLLNKHSFLLPTHISMVI